MAQAPTLDALLAATDEELERCTREVERIVQRYLHGEKLDLRVEIDRIQAESRYRHRRAMRTINDA